MTGFIGVGQLRYILTNLGEKMSNEEVDELLKAVETSPSGEVNYTGMLSFCFFDLGGENERGGMIVWKAWTWMGNRNSAHISKLSTDLVRTILAN